MSSSSSPNPPRLPVGPPEADPDVQLMLKVQADEPGAFEALVENNKMRVFRIIARFTRDVARAEDLAQDVFLKVYLYRKNYKPTARFGTWLQTITANTCLKSIRDESRQNKALPMVEGVDPPALPGMSNPDPLRSAEDAEIAAAVRAAVGELPPAQRMATLLERFEGMSYAEIAEAMDLQVGAVKSLLSRARASLRERLERWVRA